MKTIGALFVAGGLLFVTSLCRASASADGRDRQLFADHHRVLSERRARVYRVLTRRAARIYPSAA
jgi:hypothetical protein